MAFGKKGLMPGEMDVAPAAHVLRGAQEFLRMWLVPGGDVTCLIDPSVIDDPAAFGIAMVDCVRHGARAYANVTGMSEEDALDRIWMGVDAERNRPTDLGRSITKDVH